MEVPEINDTNKSEDKDMLINLMLTGFNSTPYHQHIGLTMLRETDGIKARFTKQQQLLGNVSRNMVHGGLVSSVFDAFGGVLCSIELIDKYKDLDRKQGLRKLNRLCTVGLNINYHAPAKAETFIASGTVIHQGSSIMSVSMQMHDEKNILIASASANYMY